MTVAYGLCVASFERFSKYIDHNDAIPLDSPVLALDGAKSIASGYNMILDAYKGRGYDAVILLHDDLEITDPDAEAKFLAAFADDVALVGVAGSKSAQSLYWWEHPPLLGHQRTDSGLLDFGPRTGDAAFLEGSILVFTPWAIENLRFDERYTDFRSGYDDICLHAIEAGKRNVVVDVDTLHHTEVGWRSDEVRARFEASEQFFRVKWGVR